jgi:transmembrane sensor
MSEKVNRELIVKYLNNTCSADERLLVERFLQLPESEILLNEILAEQSLQDWKTFTTDNTKSEKLPLWQEAIHQKISRKQQIRSIKKPFVLRYAAIWLTFIIGFGGYGVWRLKKNQPQTVAYFENINPNGRRSIITLPDSSVIYLGAGSKLKYPNKFAGNTREVSLTGEAFFEITKNPKKPFIIHTGDITTKVLGTSFKIEAFKAHPLSVAVATGKVRVDQHLGNHQVRSLAVLTPGQKVTWNAGKAETGQVDIADVKMWKEARLAFNDQSLRVIADELERWYDVKITFNSTEKSAERMTVTLDANTRADKTLKVLADAGKFKYHVKNNLITID